MPEFQAPVGTRDVLAPESARWEDLVARFARLAGLAGYGLVLTPVFEDVGVFERLGAATDVVRKEMYDFRDRGDRHLVLRPESTAAVVRAFVQHRPPTPWKAWYVAPHFRYERPQAGRYRQHHQLGVEVLGSDDPDVDVEVIALLAVLYRDIGLRQVRLSVNSLGDATCRPAYRDALRAHLHARRDQLCDEHRDRIDDNPLRVLDCKREPCRVATADAPTTVEHLCDACAEHFTRVRDGLASLGIGATVEARLVRGLDYYTRTAFEFAAEALDAAQNAIGGGGRYDGLAESLGGPPTPGIGFGAGIERILLACDAEGTLPVPAQAPRPDVFVVDTAGGDAARDLTHELRNAGVAADRAFDRRSMKAQFKAAGRSGARVAVVVGPDEAAAGKVGVQDLESHERTLVPRDELLAHVRERLASR